MSVAHATDLEQKGQTVVTTTLPQARPPRLALQTDNASVAVTSFNCQAMASADAQSVGITYWFDAAAQGEPYSVNVHLAGRLRGEAPTGRASTFSTIATVDNVVPGTGRVCVTTRVDDVAHGTWDVTATPVEVGSGPEGASWVPVVDPRLPGGTAFGTTAFTPVIRVRAPGVRLWAWPAMVGTGAVLALVAQSLLAPRLSLPVGKLLPLSLLACVLGLLGAKAYYLATHPAERHRLMTAGMSVQGFVIVTVATLLIGSAVLGMSPWAVLDVTAPALLLGMTVGRFGCLLGGCCTGRPTRSRWGVWSSDRLLGVRRIPVQLMESAMAAVIGTSAVIAVSIPDAGGRGLVFVASLGAYVAGRQLLFPLRSIRRITAHGRQVTLLVASVASVAALVLLLV